MGHSQYSWLNPLPQGNTLNSVYFTSENIGYAVGNYGTVLRTIDGGTNWNILNTNTTKDLNGIFFNNSNYGFVVGDSGIIITTIDSGINWTTLSSGTNADLYSIYFTDSLHGYSCGSNGKIIKTSNGGNQWNGCTSNVTTKLFSIDFPTKNTGYIVGGGGTTGGKGFVLKSKNGGDDWKIITDSLDESFYSTDFIDSLTGYAAGNFSYIVKTDDGGKNWIESDNPNSLHIRSIKFINSQIGYTCDVYGSIMKTENGGQSWANLNSKTENRLFSLNSINGSKICVVGGGGTILVSDTYGNNFLNIQNGTTKELNTIQKVDESHIYIVGDETIIQTNDGGKSWDTQTIPQLAYCKSAFFINSSVGYALTYEGIFKTTNSGLNWDLIYDSSKSDWWNNIYMVNDSLGFVVGGGLSPGGSHWGRLLKTNDGTHWTEQICPSLYSLNKTYFKNNTKGYILGPEGELYSSDDAGNTWSLIPLSIPNDLWDMTFTNENIGFILGNGSGNIILKTIDAGLNWNPVYLDYSDQNAFQTFYFFDSLNGYVVGSNGEIINTNDGGISWSTQKSFTNNPLRSILLVNDSSGYIIGYYGTFASFGNVYKEDSFNDADLLFCYPNPFSDQILFEFYSNAIDQISIELFDINGKLINKEYRSILQGKQEIILIPSLNLRSGTYIYRIKGSKIFNTGKIIKK
jgi:photosystem II stability/assembly factor-like uncharacterized protein